VTIAVVAALALAGCSLGVSNRVELVRALAGSDGVARIAEASDAPAGTVGILVALDADATAKDAADVAEKWWREAQRTDSTTTLEIDRAYSGPETSSVMLASSTDADVADVVRGWWTVAELATARAAADADGTRIAVEPADAAAASPDAVSELAQSVLGDAGVNSGGTVGGTFASWTFTIDAVGLESADGAPDDAAIAALRSLQPAWSARTSAGDVTLDVVAGQSGPLVAVDVSPEGFDDADGSALAEALPETDVWAFVRDAASAVVPSATLELSVFGGDVVAKVGAGGCEGELASAVSDAC
jgi:hypothetical protein